LLGATIIFFILCASLWRAGPAQAQSKAMASADCLACHTDANLAKEVDGKLVSLHIDEKAFNDSVHGSFDCASCHADVKGFPHDPAPSRVDCSSCHTEPVEAYKRSLHAKAVQNGNSFAASCLDCHGSAHAIVASSDSRSMTNHANLAATCARCHAEKFVMESSGISTQPFISYQASVHGRAVASGNAKAAVCTDCHSHHDVLPPSDSASPIFKFNVPRTCGKCHEAVVAEFGKSIHGQSIARGNWQSPVCTDCHGIHLIKPHIDPTSSVASQSLARTTCAQCHEGVRLADEFGIKGKRATSYLDSYHGMASQLGSNIVANCASCHGVHNILPSTDPYSMINAANLSETCGKCHPGANDQFISGRIHLDVPLSQDIASKGTRWVRWIYLTLIAVTLGFMLIHNGLIWRKKAMERRRAEHRAIERLTLNQRIQHLLLMTSFIVLAITGFALSYPDSWLAALLGSSEALRRIAHRTAAVVMMAVGLYHIFYIAIAREGRAWVRDMLPRWKDAMDVARNLAYYLGRRAERAQTGRFGYGEKIEYWAVVWGTIIMGLTGMMVWFKIEWFGFLPRWIIDIALAIHFYEAVLATLAIIVWHFYHVIFDPDVYPMNWAWLDGRVSAEFYKEEHPLAYQQMKSGAQEAQNESESARGADGHEPSPSGSASD
jgi:formate dehydrogenase gamma subunit